jgi:hypothetical protein
MRLCLAIDGIDGVLVDEVQVSASEAVRFDLNISI